jgi:hypothetical protein
MAANGAQYGVATALLLDVPAFLADAVVTVGVSLATQAAGINVDLWTGLGMLVAGILMIVWAVARPVAPGGPRRAAAGRAARAARRRRSRGAHTQHLGGAEPSAPWGMVSSCPLPRNS